jgi:predicted permease
MRDIRYALRSLARSKGFAFAVILTLGLGIGANTAIFSVVRGVMLKPLPHKDGSRLMYLKQSANGPGFEDIAFSVPEILDFRTSAKTLGGIAEYSPYTLIMVGDHDALRLDVGLVTGNYFEVMGLTTERGRTFGPGDDGRGAHPVMILTHDFWQTRFSGDSTVIGRELRVGGRAVTVVGVLQPAPNFPNRVDALMNMVNSEHHLSALMQDGRTHRMTQMVARLAPGATVDQARAEIGAITTRVHATYPEAYDAGSGYKVTVTPLQEVLGQKAKLTLWLLMGAAAFVLIIACANVANLTLMRGVRREHELAVRAALGAGTARLRKLLLAENLVLALIGAALGLVIAFGGVKMLVALAARYSPRSGEISVDGTVLAFALGLAIAVAILLSFAPTLAKESTLGASLTSGAKRATGGVKRQRMQQTLVVLQVAVSVVLLTGAGLLTRTMQRLAMVDSGLNGEHVLTMEVPADFNQKDPTAGISKIQDMQHQMAALPGVSDVAIGSTIPLRTAGFMLDMKAEGHTLAPGEPQPHSEYRTASPEYFKAAGIPLLKGRAFLETDRKGSPSVVILNSTLAERLFPNQDPIGRRVTWTGEVLKFIGMKEEWMTVVGVVGTTKDGGLDAEPLPATFLPIGQGGFPSGGIVIRANGDPASLAPAAEQIVRQVNPVQPIEHVMTVNQIRDESVAPRRLNAQLVTSFGILALIVAAVGIAAVLAFSVSARTNEIGIRMSLGADAGQVQRMVLYEGGALVGIGLVLGVAGSMVMAKMVQGLLFGVAGRDPVTLGIVAVIMTAVGIGACWVPAARASRIDPGTALRAQ